MKMKNKIKLLQILVFFSLISCNKKELDTIDINHKVILNEKPNCGFKEAKLILVKIKSYISHEFYYQWFCL